MPDSSPATKDDIKLLMEQIGSYYQQTEKRFAELTEHFDLTVETIRHDLTGAHRDRIEDHEQRIGRLERIAGVQPR